MAVKRRVCVLGAGIIGVSSAVCIQSEIHDVDVTVMADKFTPDTTGDGSAGFWLPHLLNPGQKEDIMKWGKVTYDHLFDLVQSPNASDVGAILLSGYQFCTTKETFDCKDQIFGLREVTVSERLLHPEKKAGITYTTVAVDVKAYLPWLMKKFRSKGGTIVKQHVTSLEEIKHKFDIIVNCTGLGSYKLVNDKNLKPIRGQTMRVYAPWIKHFYVDADPKIPNNEIYILPGHREVVLGGTSQSDNWSTEVDNSDKDNIWQQCCKLVPSLKKATVLYDWVGLRPQRTKVRLELENIGKGAKIVHNYGHSGSGVSLHWGCAVEAARLVKEAILLQKSKL